MGYIQLNYAFLLFWSILGKIHRKILFFNQKVTISERSREILRKLVFLIKFEKGQIQKKNWICCKQPFLFKAVKREKILTKTVFLFKISHLPLKYSYLLFWRIINWKLLVLVIKVTISERSPEILRNFVFLNKFETEKIQKKIRFVLKNPFCSKQ